MAFGIQDILEFTGGSWVNRDAFEGDAAALRVSRPAPLEQSGRDAVAFFFSKEYRDDLMKAMPGVLVTAPPFVGPISQSGHPLWKRSAVIACADPYLAMAVLSEKFAPTCSFTSHLPEERAQAEGRVHPTAVVDPGAKLERGVEVGPHAVIEAGARVGAGSVIGAGCVIGRDTTLGKACVLFPRVTIYERCVLGDRVRIHSGAVIGADGFGFAPRMQDGKPVGHQKIFHLGRVVIGNDVEIGANTCIDRGTFGDTVLADQVKLDNLVQVGHNARLDEGSMLCGSAAMAGSSSLGRYVIVGGLTGISNKVHLGDGSRVGALSLVAKDVPAGQTVLGNPHREYSEHFRAHAALNKLIRRKPRGAAGGGPKE